MSIKWYITLIIAYERSNDMKQILLFGIVGVVCTIVDFSLLYVFTSICGITYLMSNLLSVSISTSLNYILSQKIVFHFTNSYKNGLLFILLSTVALFLSELLMFIFIENFNITYIIAKIFTTIIVMIFNFVTRKYIII